MTEQQRGRRRVVVTGLGATTPLGGDVATTWRRLLAGESGVRTLTEEWAADLPVRIGARVAVEPTEVLDRVEARTLDRSQQFALIAARQAWEDAGRPEVDRERLGVVFASGIGGVTTLLNAYDVLREKGPRRVSPYTVPMLMPNGPAAAVGLDLGAQAGVHTPVSACASGAEAIAYGLEMIRSGRADVAVCGGTEAAIHALPLAAFASMRALSTRNDEPERASRPYDKARDGFVMGEGAGAVVLEEFEYARARGARILGEIAGAGLSSDGYHITAPDPEARGAVRALRSALADADLSPADIVHINAHATSTPIGDVAEAKGIREVFGSAADGIVVTAPKSSFGHLLGAAGAVEAIATLLAVREKVSPPTLNLENQDDEVDLDIAALEPRPLRDGAALSNSFGFGGHNVVLVIRAS
ncbi:3-oxoacyl-[acyl-carrier-protein] synthase II [Acidothermus cellulolyticus 11B]|uniref:3-oxoacyl-[acyl-carrier-protein] synthase 2 n=1 Tax=Acidothermus cellulolyticus (strain ATCC 43068 / DSM 8971 / 11B) TaxID=351607 RepID=A0LT88_ACIC1|nr:beta-ketoacyl-ACP synthase II [Acidothermus cellulolyticus]ABK52648.1 3-oxoacyl-[acyl-carrier-protein] synthase II [Acidothermus cellulolyticus 11B]